MNKVNEKIKLVLQRLERFYSKRHKKRRLILYISGTIFKQALELLMWPGHTLFLITNVKSCVEEAAFFSFQFKIFECYNCTNKKDWKIYNN